MTVVVMNEVECNSRGEADFVFVQEISMVRTDRMCGLRDFAWPFQRFGIFSDNLFRKRLGVDYILTTAIVTLCVINHSVIVGEYGVSIGTLS